MKCNSPPTAAPTLASATDSAFAPVSNTVSTPTPDSASDPVPAPVSGTAPVLTTDPDPISTPVPAVDPVPALVPDPASVPDSAPVQASVPELVSATIPDFAPDTAPVPDPVLASFPDPAPVPDSAPVPSKTVGVIKLLLQNDIELLPKFLTQPDVIMDKRRTRLLSRCGQSRSKSQSRKDVTDMRPIREYLITPGKRKASDSATSPTTDAITKMSKTDSVESFSPALPSECIKSVNSEQVSSLS